MAAVSFHRSLLEGYLTCHQVLDRKLISEALGEGGVVVPVGLSTVNVRRWRPSLVVATALGDRRIKVLAGLMERANRVLEEASAPSKAEGLSS